MNRRIHRINRFKAVVIGIFITIILTACGTDGLYRFMLITDGEHVLTHELTGDLIITGGAVTLPAGAILDGSVHLLSGSLNAAGQINGDVSFMNGELTLQPGAYIGGVLNLGGGTYHASPAAVIRGRVNKGAGIALPDLPEQNALSGTARLLRTLVSGSLLGLAAAVLTRYFPRMVSKVGEAALSHTVVSGAVGLLVGIVGSSLLITMAYTILLIPATILGLIVLAAGVLFGWIGLGTMTGHVGLRVLKRQPSPSAAAFLGTWFFVMIMELLTSIPAVGGLIGIALAAIGLGAVSLTRFGLQRFVPVQSSEG